MFGGLLAWPVSDFLGRQAALIIGGIPALIGWLFIANAVQIFNRAAFLFVLFSGRVLTGFAAGWSIFCVSVSNDVTNVFLSKSQHSFPLNIAGVHC